MSTCRKRPASYWTTCDCTDCVELRRRARARAYGGLRRRVSSDQAWHILAPLIDDHWSATALGSATGLRLDYFGGVMADYRRGHRRYFGPVPAEAIVRMTWPTEGHVGATGTRRRLQALARIGYGLETIAAESGVGFSTLGQARTRNLAVKAGTALAVREAYERLHMTPGDDAQAARYAAAQGWCGPLAWDRIDDPADVPRTSETTDAPDPVVVERILAGDWRLAANRAERLAVVARWTGSLAQLEKLTGWNCSRYKGEAA